MAKRKKQKVVVELPDVDEEMAEEVRAPTKTDEELDVEDLLSEIPLDARAQLWRWSEDAGWSYVAQFPVQQFSLDVVSQRYGPGKYRLVVRGPRTDEAGRTRIVQLARRHFAVGSATGTSASPAEALGLNLSQMLTFNLQALQALANAPRPDPAEMIKAVIDLVRPQQERDPMTLALQLVQALKGGEKTSVREVLEVLQMGMELGERVSAPDDGLGQFAKALAGLVEKLPSKSEASRPAITPAPAESKAADEEIVQYFSALRPVLTKAAQRQGDPSLYAELMLDQLPLALEPYLPVLLNDPSYPANVMPYLAGVPEGYLRLVLGEFKRLFNEGSEDSDSEGAGGNGDHG